MRSMTLSRRALLPAALLLFSGSLGCGDSPLPTATVDSPGPSQPKVTVALASVELAGDCGGISTGTSTSPPAGGSCAQGADCRGACQQSAVQIKIAASDGKNNVTFQVIAIRIRDESNNTELDHLSARLPKRWSNGSYVAWDQTIAPLDDFTVTYQTSSPDWTRLIAAGGTYRTAYRVEVELLVGGQARTVSIDGVTRAAPMAT